MYRPRFQRASAIVALSFAVDLYVSAQSGATRPRRVLSQPPTEASAADTAAPPARTTSTNSPVAGSGPSAAAGTTTARAYVLLEQKQYEAAAKEAKGIAAADPKNAEAWKIAGFAEMNLKQYAEAAADLQRALDLQRATKEEDPNTIDALAQAYVRTEKFDLALPLLAAATTRPGKQPDPSVLYYRGLAEYRTGKAAEAERSFNGAIKLDPKNAPALFYLGRIAYERNETDAAISMLNRATLADSRLADAWLLLTYSYLRRAGAAANGPKAEADYLNAVRAGENLTRLRTDEASAALYGQALISAKEYARASSFLERAAATDAAQSQTLYLLGVAYSRIKNMPKAISALERATARPSDDASVNANIYRELGYAYEVTKQYAKALRAYEQGLQSAPAEADLKESVERVRPFAK